MTDPFRVLSGETTATYENENENGDADGATEDHGRLLTLVKPDGTVLVHDADGYRPVAWLTRPATAAVEPGGAGPTVRASDGDRRLRVHVHDDAGVERYPASPAGSPVGPCPACGTGADGPAGTLVRADGAVVCVGCGARHGLPAGATVLDERCECGLPRMRVERGRAFGLCVDRACEPLDDAVAEAFDGAWDCPACGADLEVRRARSLVAGCERYPDCRTAFRVPEGVLAGVCGCGLPLFAPGCADGDGDGDGTDAPADARCLDATCERPSESPRGRSD